MRCVIVGGAKISNYPFVRSYLKKDDFVIYCDCGLNHIHGLDIQPSLTVGDFDSHMNPRSVLKRSYCRVRRMIPIPFLR